MLEKFWYTLVDYVLSYDEAATIRYSTLCLLSAFTCIILEQYLALFYQGFKCLYTYIDISIYNTVQFSFNGHRMF